MRVGVAFTGGLLLITVLVACRDHEPVCSSAECRAAQQANGGESGATDGDDHADAGEPGACRHDRECDNGSACDGRESCVDGACVSGAALTCPLETMACADEAAGECVFESPSPWLVFGTGPTLEALPTKLIGVSAPLVLATQSSKRAMGFALTRFSARGDLALTLLADEEFLDRWQYTRFGAGVPGPLRDLPEVPTLTSSFRGPWIASDSTYVLLLDDVAGAFFAPLTDAGAETIRVPLAELDIYDADYCEESPSFWYVERTGTSGIATPEAHGLRRRALSGSDVVFSPDRRILAQLLPETEDAEPSARGVAISRCAAEGVETLFEETSAPIISPTSESVLLQYPDGSRKLFSLEDPEARLELWSSEETALDVAAVSADGTRIVGLVNDVVHVAEWTEAPELVPIGLPEGTILETAWAQERGYVTLVGKAALVASVPDEEGFRGPLVWQSLTPGRQPVQLLSATEAAASSLLLSNDDVNELFITTTLDGAREQLSRVRLDTERPELEPLVTLEGEIDGVQRASDDSGLLITLSTRELTSASWWLPLSAGDQVGEPLLVSPRTRGASFQPRP